MPYLLYHDVNICTIIDEPFHSKNVSAPESIIQRSAHLQ